MQLCHSFAVRACGSYRQVLREREEELSHLLHLLAQGLAQPSDLEPFLKCLHAFRSLWSLALRPQHNRAEAAPWLKARPCIVHCAEWGLVEGELVQR